MKANFDPSRRLNRFGQETSAPTPIRVIGRVLVCTVCGLAVDVLEAALGARTDEEHRYLDPATYVCGDCQAPALVELASEPGTAVEGAGRARTALESAA